MLAKYYLSGILTAKVGLETKINHL